MMQLSEDERNDLSREAIEGCIEMWALYQEVDRAWESAADEVWRQAEQPAES